MPRLRQGREASTAPTEAPTDYQSITCGHVHPNPKVEERLSALRRETGFVPHDGLGCGEPLPWTTAYRCVQCARWFHGKCILEHFAATSEPVNQLQVVLDVYDDRPYGFRAELGCLCTARLAWEAFGDKHCQCGRRWRLAPSETTGKPTVRLLPRTPAEGGTLSDLGMPTLCPECGGKGSTELLACGFDASGKAASWRQVSPCNWCQGSGFDSALQKQRRLRGNSMRATRVAANLSQAERALHLGADVGHYSRVEAGLEDPTWATYLPDPLTEPGKTI